MLPPFQVLISHQLSTYASALAGVLVHLRPQFLVEVVAPTDLTAGLLRWPNALLVTDCLPTAGVSGAGWILYYPGQENVAIVNIGGIERQFDNPALEDILAELDAAAALRLPHQRGDALPVEELELGA
jgi:hypothetical protein